MKSMNRQCDELVALLQQIQTCVDREGWPIPLRAADFEVYIARARELIGVIA